MLTYVHLVISRLGHIPSCILQLHIPHSMFYDVSNTCKLIGVNGGTLHTWVFKVFILQYKSRNNNSAPQVACEIEPCEGGSTIITVGRTKQY